MSSVFVNDGFGTANQMRVASDGSAPVAPAESNSDTTYPAVQSAASKIVPARVRRRQVQILNRGPSDVHIRLKSDGADTRDFKLATGDAYSFPPGVTYTGEIWAVTPAGTADLTVMEFME